MSQHELKKINVSTLILSIFQLGGPNWQISVEHLTFLLLIFVQQIFANSHAMYILVGNSI